MIGHRYWRVINIYSREPTKGNWDVGLYKLKFITESGINANDATKITVQSLDNQSWVAPVSALVSDDNNTGVVVSATSNREKWWIAYDFTYPELVISLSYQAWADWGYEWQTAEIEFSDDNINWYKYGIILPFISKNDGSNKIIPIISEFALNIVPNHNTTYLNIYSQNEQGSITGSVKELGLPENSEVGLYDRKTRQLIALTRSVGGAYSFVGIDKNREYYVHAIDDHRLYNAVTQDMLSGNYDNMKARGLL